MEASQWLQQLPKPVALFCCDDAHALFISETCKMTNIPIPEEIALLGVDNDELMCNISDPPISSIELEVEKRRIFYRQTYSSTNKKGTRRYFQYCYQSYPHRITAIYGETQYQRPLYSGSSEVYRVSLQFRFDHRVSACKHSAIPQKLRSEIQNALNTSIYQYILNCRCNHLADLLLTTDRPLADLAMEVGFTDYNNIARIFKKFKGCSPIEYRQKKTRQR